MKSVITLGLGYIGLPTSALIASKGIKVYGVDINKGIVKTINSGNIHIIEPGLDNLVKETVKRGFLKAGVKPVKGDVYLIVVPTPFRENYEPDISYIESATNSIIPILKKGDLYIIESTSPVGTTNKMRDLILSKRPDLKDEISIAYCPERVLPGNVIHELVHNDRVVGGVDERSTRAAIKFYKSFVKGELHPTDAKTAEMCKLTENASRDMQIAFANELSLICKKADINVWDLINLANKHPRVNILQPGCGVGGHCIAVDPYFIASHFPNESQLIQKAREINNYKPLWVIDQVNKKIEIFRESHNRNPSVAILGLAFKPNIDDLRESPALEIAIKLKTHSEEVRFYFVEPNIQSHSKLQIEKIETAIQKSDIMVFLVGHKEFRNLKYPKKIEIMDFCGILN